jgi:hypothetical protein
MLPIFIENSSVFATMRSKPREFLQSGSGRKPYSGEIITAFMLSGSVKSNCWPFAWQSGGNHLSAPAQPEVLAKVGRIKAACKGSESRSSLALHFSLAQPAAAAVIPGASKPKCIAEDHTAFKETIPADFWIELRKQGFVAANAPLPIDAGREVGYVARGR